MSRSSRMGTLEKTSLVAIASLWGLIVVFPLYMVVDILFSPRSAAVLANFHPFPTSWSAGMDNMAQVLKDNMFVSGFTTSLIYSILQVAGMLLIVSMAAFQFSLFSFKGKRFLFMLALSSMMVPMAVTIIPTFKIVVALHWLNSYAGLAVPGMASASSLFILVQFMETIPRELLQSAEMDGASHFRKYAGIVLPLTRNALVTVGLLAFLGAWGNLLWPLVVVNLPEMYPISLVIGKYASALSTLYPLNVQLAAFFLSAVPPIVIYLIFQKSIVDGITASGVKG